MGIVSYQDYLFYLDIVKYVFLSIGLASFLFYSSNKNLKPLSKGTTLLLFVLMVVVLGAFPMIDVGADRDLYWAEAQNVAMYNSNFRDSDIGYFYINKLLTLFPLDLYFYLHSILYLIGIFIFSKSLHSSQYGVIFLCMIFNFQFVSYGVNTMRAGLAGSTVLMAIAFRNRRIVELAFLLLAIMIHKSFALPAICYLITKKYDKTKLYFYIWLLSILLSAIGGGFFQVLFSSVLGDEERASYLTTDAASTHYNVEFRIDFILFSCAPIVFGFYMIYKRKFKDVLYKNLYNMYLLANTFWILVIRANFSDRFAYLSWFIYCPLLIYPLIKQPNIVSHSYKWVAYCILGLTLFRSFI